MAVQLSPPICCGEAMWQLATHYAWNCAMCGRVLDEISRVEAEPVLYEERVDSTDGTVSRRYYEGIDGQRVYVY